ncbi:MAG: dihydroxyacetone kinase operon transcriptional regulator DhaR [Candidatus Promineifilaceae bacterium]|nr:dihydroxyacetone kinase operon transcriptional regulator DhaR [Candidatus Promineifilaceae bacterium]
MVDKSQLCRNMAAMEPSAYPIDLDGLARIWHAFVSKGKINRQQEAQLDPTVLQSWRRCMPRLNPLANPRLSPARGSSLESVLRAQADLISICTPIIEDIHQFIEGSNSAILLSDGSGCILAVGGDESAMQEIKALNLGLGTYWSEGQLGTNALGIVLDSAMPVQVVGAEHYYQCYHRFSTSAAPIHNIYGRIIGIIVIVNKAKQATSHTLALVMSAARAISNQLQADWSLQEANQRLSEMYTVMSSISEGIIAWDVKDEITHVNVQACDMLNLNAAAIMGMPIGEVIDLPEVIEVAVREDSELKDAEVNFSNNGRSMRALVTLRSITDASHVRGHIILLRPIEQVRQLVQQQAGSHTTITVDDVYGESPVMRQVVRQIRIAARGLAPVLLQGEGGVGKNHIAHAIHNDGARTSKPFLSINCRAIPHEIMASQLLGEENGTHIRPSKFELADGGTLLLDQVDSLSLEMQAALLQVIETGHVMHLGGIGPIPVDVRIIAATTENLSRRVADGSFLPHLYYRFGVFNITIPPLRQRAEDLPLLVKRFQARMGEHDGQTVGIDDEALAILSRYPWPGNVRELESVLERAMHQSNDGIIHAVDLSDAVRQGRVLTRDSPDPLPLLSVAEAEQEAIIRAGWACHGRIGDMARDLKIGRTTLWRKMKRYNISPEQFKQRRR